MREGGEELCTSDDDDLCSPVQQLQNYQRMDREYFTQSPLSPLIVDVIYGWYVDMKSKVGFGMFLFLLSGELHSFIFTPFNFFYQQCI